MTAAIITVVLASVLLSVGSLVFALMTVAEHLDRRAGLHAEDVEEQL